MKMFTYLILFLSFAFAGDMQKEGYRVFQKSCSTCHVERVSPKKLAQIERVVKSGGKPPLKAPPMSEVSARVKKFYPEEEDFVSFVKDYITNPSKDKGVCLPMAYKVFGVMPPIGRTLTEAEKEAVARWLYHNFKESWEEFIRKNPH
ncbi:c-type cytochrome [Hydrogenivirga sp.]